MSIFHATVQALPCILTIWCALLAWSV